MKYMLMLLFVSTSFYTLGQNTFYVSAPSGLLVREKPDKNAMRVAKLDFGTPVSISNKTGIKLTIIDNNENIYGEWVQIKEHNSGVRGYVFNGYLVAAIGLNPLVVDFKDFEFQINLDTYTDTGIAKGMRYKEHDPIPVDLGDSPESKIIKINKKSYKKVAIYQRYETSITIMNEGPHCDLIDWQHYTSPWQELSKVTDDLFLSTSYGEKASQKFVPVSILDLKKAVSTHCGGYWTDHVKQVKNVTDYPSAVTISRIFFKIVLTDKNNTVTEKIVTFEIPMGC